MKYRCTYCGKIINDLEKINLGFMKTKDLDSSEKDNLEYCPLCKQKL